MIEEVLKSFITLFVIMDPPGILPIFLGMIKGMPANVVRQQIRKAIGVASLLMLAFVFLGIGVLGVFGIDLVSFKIAGGIILLFLGIRYVLGLEVKQKKEDSHDLSVPIGTPLLVGPGVITTIIILVDANGVVITFMAALLTLIVATIILSFATFFYRLLGRHWTNVLSRVMGIVLAAIAVDFIREGILETARGIL